MEKKENKTPVVTRAEKKEIVKNLIKEALTKKEYKHNDLIEDVAGEYAKRHEGEADNMNDVKGRVGSVLDIMKKQLEVSYEGGMYALTAKKAEENAEEKPKKQTRRKTKKEEVKEENLEEVKEVKEEVKAEEKPKKTTRARKTKEVKEEAKAETKEEEGKGTPMPPAPLQPIAQTAPVTPEVAPEPIPEKKPRRTRKKAQTEEQVVVVTEVKTEEKVEKTVQTERGTAQEVKEEKEQKEQKEPTALTEVKKGELAQKPTVMDMSFLFGAPKTIKTEAVKQEKEEEQPKEQPKVMTREVVKQEKVEEKKEEKKEERREYPTKQPRPQPSQQPKQQSNTRKIQLKKTVKVLTAEEKLKEAFLKRIRSLGGDYFEYYSVYLLERYSRQNGRRLESLRITAGDHDGGIDGEIELTDKLGFRETIYIQSKNWNPEKGDERLWIVGETLLQQFIGACACRQAKDGKQHCRGIFITTSRFTPEAKRILESMSDKIVGYDGTDLFETAKECSFGLIKKNNGEWALDENLLSGEKAFFSMM